MTSPTILIHKELRRRYSKFFNELLKIHHELNEIGLGNRGHGPEHDTLVAGYCLLIAGNDNRLAEMTWIAAHLHSLDRFFKNKYEEMINGMLAKCEELSQEEITEIKFAVMHHDQPNEDDDSALLIVLKDADRLANVMPHVIARSGQFQPGLPVIEQGYIGLEKHPLTTKRSPRSIHDDLLGCLEWHSDSDARFAIRTEVAKKIGEELFDYLRMWFTLSHKHLKMTGFE